MKALCLLILSALFVCSVGYTIVERPANVEEHQYYERFPSGKVQSRPPLGFWFQQHPYNLPKPESQALFELYYLIQVITTYRHHHPRAHRSHLDALVEQLQDDRFQQRLRQALNGNTDLDQVGALQAEWNLQDYAHFVNDRRQLIPAIHRALNEISLGQIKDFDFRRMLERLIEESSALTVKMARKEAEVLKELIEANRKVEKIWTVSDILAAVFGKQDEETMKDFDKKYEVVDDGKPVDDGKVEEFWVVFEDDKKGEVSSTTGAPELKLPELNEEIDVESVVVEDTIMPVKDNAQFQFIDDNYERSEAKEVKPAEEEQDVEQPVDQDTELKEDVESAVEDEVVEEQESQPEEEVETVAEDEEYTSNADLEENVVDESDVFEFREENYERSEPEEESQYFERLELEDDVQDITEDESVDAELPDTVPEELQNLDAVESVDQPESDVFTDTDDQPDVEDSVDQLDSEYTEQLEEESAPEEIPEQAIQEQAISEQEIPEQEIPELEPASKSTSDTITFPEDPQWVEDSVRPLGSSAATGLDSNPPKVVYDSEELPSPLEDAKPEPLAQFAEVETSVAQSVPLWISKGYGGTEYEAREIVDEEEPQIDAVQEIDTEVDQVESREDVNPAGTAEIDQETLRYVAFEILKVVSLLEDNAGFAGLRDQITVEDVDSLIDQLSMEQFVSLIDEQGINRGEMINALERLIEEKNLENSSEIVAVLEQWKQGEGVEKKDDGYFGENYGKADEGEDLVESRTIEDDQFEEAEQVVATVDEAQDAEQLVDELEGELGADSELQDENAEDNTLNETESELEAVEDLKTSDHVEDTELLNNSPQLLEDETDLSESISKVEDLEGAESTIVDDREVNPQHILEEGTKDSDSTEEQRLETVEEETKEEEVADKTGQVDEAAVDLNSEILKPFPDHILSESQPLEIALDEIEPFPDQILNESQSSEITSDDQVKEVTKTDDHDTTNHPFPETPVVGSEPLEVARAGTDEGALDEERREEILEDLHPEP